MQVIKRDGLITEYDSTKVLNAIAAAMEEVEGFVDTKYAKEIEEVVRIEVSDSVILDVESIQDLVELELMKVYPHIAKAYILYRDKKANERKKEWDLNELQRDIFNSKYRHDGESFDEFIQRVSGGNTDVAKIIRNQDFSYGGRILAGRGLDRNITLSNCYVLPSPEDNLESIFDIAKYAARTYSYGGGVGFDLSNLRPEGASVNNAALSTSGPVSFMDLYDTTTSVIGQKGRRGALMLSMSTDHVDIDKFVKSKANTDKINHANISVRANGDFFKQDTDAKVNTMKLIAQNNWETGEPGMLFWDRVEDWHMLSHHPEYVLESTNPCGEQPLPAFGNCLLGSINLSNFVIDPFTVEARFDYDRLKEVTRTSIIGLNEVLHEGIPLHPLEEQRQAANNFRQIGLGMMGLADALIKMGIRYGSTESLIASKGIGMIIRDEAIRTSVDLVEVYGTYPKYDYNIVSKSNYFKSLPSDVQGLVKKKGMANSHLLSIAPTGSISTLFGISGGIEPIFANSFTRTTKSLGAVDRDYKVYTKVIDELMNTLNIEKESELPDYCVTSHDIKPIDRIKLQGKWQDYVDSAISSTINLDESASVEDIMEIYLESYKHGLKGVTVFRNNSFRMGILNTEEELAEEECST